VRSTSGTQPATEDQIKNQVVTMAVGLSLATSDVTVTIVNASGTPQAWSTPNASNSTVKISGQYNFTPAIPLVPIGTITLNASSEMALTR